MDTLKEQLRKVIEDSLDIQDVSRSLHDDCINLRTKLLQIGNEYASRGTDGISKNVPDENTPVRQTKPLTKVMVRDYTESVWQEGLFIEYDESSEDHPFRCVVAETVLWWNFCKIED